MKAHHAKRPATNMKAVNFAAFVVVVIAGIGLAMYYQSIQQQREAAEWQRMAGANALIDAQQAINAEDYRLVGVNIDGNLLVPGIEDITDTERFGVRAIRGEGAFDQQSSGEQRVRRLVEKYMHNYNKMMSRYVEQTKPPT